MLTGRQPDNDKSHPPDHGIELMTNPDALRAPTAAGMDPDMADTAVIVRTKGVAERKGQPPKRCQFNVRTNRPSGVDGIPRGGSGRRSQQISKTKRRSDEHDLETPAYHPAFSLRRSLNPKLIRYGPQLRKYSSQIGSCMTSPKRLISPSAGQ